jgi:formate-dependent nitrite reductase membrane component NrfD
MVGQAFLWLGIIAGLAAVTLVLLNATGNYENRFGMTASFVAGGLVLVGVVIWMIIMPDLNDIGTFEDADISYGFGFFLAIISSLMALGAGGYRFMVNRN